MEITLLPRKIDPAKVPLQELAANSNIPEKEKVNEVCRQFEAVLLLQILRDARKAVLDAQKSKDFSGLEIYADMINQQLAESISHSGMFGLGKSLQGQLTNQVSSSTAALHQKAIEPGPSTENL